MFVAFPPYNLGLNTFLFSICQCCRLKSFSSSARQKIGSQFIKALCVHACVQIDTFSFGMCLCLCEGLLPFPFLSFSSVYWCAIDNLRLWIKSLLLPFLLKVMFTGNSLFFSCFLMTESFREQFCRGELLMLHCHRTGLQQNSGIMVLVPVSNHFMWLLFRCKLLYQIHSFISRSQSYELIQ